MTTICTTELKEMFADLKLSIQEYYATLHTSELESMDSILRNCDKMDLFLEQDYRSLWRMEQEERRRLAVQLESIPVRLCQPEEVSTIERRDSCTSMPGLEEVLEDDVEPVNLLTALPPVENETLVTSALEYIAPSPQPINTSRYLHLLNVQPTLAWSWASASPSSFVSSVVTASLTR